MKITKTKLKRIIKEEIQSLLCEGVIEDEFEDEDDMDAPAGFWFDLENAIVAGVEKLGSRPDMRFNKEIQWLRGKAGVDALQAAIQNEDPWALGGIVVDKLWGKGGVQ
jgi:hypothetical protein